MAITPQALRDYLLDMLPDAELAAVERALRNDAQLRAELEQVREQLDRGDHSLGAIWRRERLTCPTRDQLAGYLIGAIDPELEGYIRFHLDIVGCTICQANRDDLEQLRCEPVSAAEQRQQRIVTSSVGLFGR
jgi:hypothetical protein